jgi:sulfur relay (sulfurtransferase) complex TusBCD TusD component (DsrE family)
VALMDRPDLMLLLTGAPYASDLVTTALRLLDAVLAKGGTVRVWACGYATMLTQCSLGEVKPGNMRELGRDYPSTASVVRRMLADYRGQLAWDVCRFCSEERGATGHIDEVRVRSPLKIGKLAGAATKVLYIGGA